MADTGWLRFLGANRSRTHGLTSPRSEPALQDLVKSSQGHDELHTRHVRKSMKRQSSWQGQCPSVFGPEQSMDEVDKLFINAGQQVWHSPSIDQVAEALRVAVMTNPAHEPLPVENRPYILHLVEGYSKIHHKVARLEAELAEAKSQRAQEIERHSTMGERWMIQEARYKAEVKRLELVIHEVSGKSLEAVALARAGSLIRGRPKAPAEERGMPGGDAVDERACSASPETARDEHADKLSHKELRSQHGTILSRRRTMDTSNEVRLSRRFRRLDNIIWSRDADGTHRDEEREGPHGKARREQDRTKQPSRRDTRSSSGSSLAGEKKVPPHEGSAQKKRDVAEPGASEDIGQDEHGKSTVAGSESEHSKAGDHVHRVRGQHRRQFSFVPGDDTAAVRLTETMASRNPEVAQHYNGQEAALGRSLDRSPHQDQRSRSAEWAGTGDGSRPVTDDTPGATALKDGPSEKASCGPQIGPGAN
ncbi:hypothetical protein FZEAL_3257 [Fusarium zealandicum]|uniref:Uncharacterized protein n=1 Tax=Fusarium zealandicum TaxID=1053134 RepID=A0A8H4XMS1_9HYPO|nr:hypothetical protein FZEAL_3257 [Fusarium zealandicum]